MIKIYFTFILEFFMVICIKAQLHSDKVNNIRKDVMTINSKTDSLSKLFKFDIDSIKIVLNCYEDKFITNNLFVNSKTNMEIDYYLKDDNLILVKIIEESPKYKNIGKKFTEFYFENNENFDTLIYYLRPTGLCWKPEDDINIIFGYNKSLDIVFLKEYTINLYKVINEKNR